MKRKTILALGAAVFIMLIASSCNRYITTADAASGRYKNCKSVR